MKNRKFGVEIECGLPPARDCDYACECGDDNCVLDDDTYVDELLAEANKKVRVSKEWSYCFDGTWVEFASPILQGPRGFAELQRMMTFLLERDAYVTGQDGMHVHHDAPEFVNDPDKTKQLVLSWVQNVKYINEFVEKKRVNSYPCSGWQTAAHVEALFAIKPQPRYFGREHDLNIDSLPEHGTIELRLHEGCLDFDRAEAWIRFGQAFINKVSNEARVLPTADDHADLLRRLRVAQKARESLISRIPA